jgi:hypothetical protein
MKRGPTALGSGAMRRLLSLGLALALAACGSSSSSPSDDPAPAPTPAEDAPPSTGPGVLLDVAGELDDADGMDPRGRFDRHFVEVNEGDRVVVDLTSQAFDPLLEVTPPQSGTLHNDDWQGDTTHSRIELISPGAGTMRIDVRPYARDGHGPFTLRVERVSGAPQAQDTVTVLAGPGTHASTIRQSDPATGETHTQAMVLRLAEPSRVRVSGEGATATLIDPRGQTLQAEEDGSFRTVAAGSHNLAVQGAVGTAFEVTVEAAPEGVVAPLLARAHHRFGRILESLVPGSAAGSLAAAPGAGAGAPDPTAAAPPTPSAPPASLPVEIGARLQGNLTESDPALPSGERYDVYTLTVAQATDPVTVTLESTAFDCFLRIEGPNGQHWENDDAGGTLNSRVELPLAVPGEYRLVATSYAAGMTGPYELKVLEAAAATGPGAAPAAGGGQRVETGSLAAGDEQLQSGEYVDAYEFTWPVGTRIHLEARSSDFDTYLIVRSPSGSQQDNDDMIPGQTLNAGLDLQVTEPGAWRVLVTSYRPGETGNYQLLVQGGGAGAVAPAAPPTSPATPPPGAPPAATPAPTGAPLSGPGTQTGTLAQGDSTLRTGEYTDTYQMTFTPRSAVQLRLNSSDFDTYLIVRSPAGQQEDNDDITPGDLNSGIDIPTAEPGTYTVIVTSYRPGETGAYTLTATEGASVVAPRPPPSAPPSGAAGTPAAAPLGQGGRVWGSSPGSPTTPPGWATSRSARTTPASSPRPCATRGSCPRRRSSS